MSRMFEPTEINGMPLANRFVRSATWTGMAAEDGLCTPPIVKLTSRLARGYVGLIISGHAYVSPDGRAARNQLGISEDRFIPGLRKLTRAVHADQGKIILQLSHAGFFAYAKLTGMAPWAPSQVKGFARTPRKALPLAVIKQITESFSCDREP